MGGKVAELYSQANRKDLKMSLNPCSCPKARYTNIPKRCFSEESFNDDDTSASLDNCLPLVLKMLC